MKKDGRNLLAALSQYGYPLLEPESKMDPNKLVTSLVKSKDARLLEGFPVVLANILLRADQKFNVNAVGDSLSPPNRKLLRFLYTVSCQLFDLYRLEFPQLKWKDRAHDEQLKSDLANDRALKFEGTELNSKRLKETFLNYFVNSNRVKSVAREEKTKLSDEFRKEYFLSLLLSPGQKDLLYKKLRGETLTKTEREYFSRVVKKKLQALADPDLHHLAQKALQVP